MKYFGFHEGFLTQAPLFFVPLEDEFFEPYRAFPQFDVSADVLQGNMIFPSSIDALTRCNGFLQ